MTLANLWFMTLANFVLNFAAILHRSTLQWLLKWKRQKQQIKSINTKSYLVPRVMKQTLEKGTATHHLLESCCDGPRQKRKNFYTFSFSVNREHTFFRAVSYWNCELEDYTAPYVHILFTRKSLMCGFKLSMSVDLLCSSVLATCLNRLGSLFG